MQGFDILFEASCFVLSCSLTKVFVECDHINSTHMVITIQIINREGKPPHHLEVVSWIDHHHAIHQVTVLEVAQRSLGKHILELIAKTFTDRSAVTITQMFT